VKQMHHAETRRTRRLSVADQAGIRAGSGGFDISVQKLTDLRGGVIASTAPSASNYLVTGSLRASDITNNESYFASSFNAGFGLGPNQARDANGNLITSPSSSLPGLQLGSTTFSTSIPSFAYASGSQASLTRSAIAPASILFRNDATGFSASGDAASMAALATLSRDTSTAHSALTKQFTEAKRNDIALGFIAARQLAVETAVFFQNRAREQANAEAAAITAGVETIVLLDSNNQPVRDENGEFVRVPRRDPQGNMIGLTDEATKQIRIAEKARNTFGAGSPARILATAIAGAAGGNVTGTVDSLIQNTAIYALQSLAVTQVKRIF
jgi:filamentous hemagglutinin